MAIAAELSRYIGTPYDYASSPIVGQESSRVNCQKLIHLLYKDRFGISLPTGLWSKEIYDDNAFFRNIAFRERFVEGDILIFGPRNPQSTNPDPRQYHLTFFTGEVNQSQDPVLIHASSYHGGTVTTNGLKTFFNTPQHASLKRVKRLQPHLFKTHVLPVIYQ